MKKKTKKTRATRETPIPNICETPEILIENDEQPFITVRKKTKGNINMSDEHQSVLWWTSPLSNVMMQDRNMNTTQLNYTD